MTGNMDILEYMRKMLEAGEISKEDIVRAFPKLNESEDERIRKWLIDYFDKVNDEVVKEDRLKIIAYLEKQEEQKPNIELIQHSWYTEGYHDREFGKEPKWIIKTGEDGPKYEENPKYGQMLEAEQKPAEWMAGQGCTVEIDEGYFINNPHYDRRKGKFHKYYSSTFGHSKKIVVTPGDEVVVQIRKK